MMTLDKFLKKNKDMIVEQWFSMIIGTYSEQSVKYLSKKDNTFANPIGAITAVEIEQIYEHLIEPKIDFNISEHLEPIVRMRAVQDFSPAQAAEFILFLKKIVHKLVEEQNLQNDFSADMFQFESKIDDLLLNVFDLYVTAKTILIEMKAGQENRTWGKMVERLNKKYDYVDKHIDADNKEKQH